MLMTTQHYDTTLTKEEQDLVDSVNNGEWKSVDNLEEEKERYAAMARNTQRKNKSISIRLTEGDLMRIKSRALEEGLPYQTLISSIIHKYAMGKDFAK